MPSQRHPTQGQIHLKFWQERLDSPNFVYLIQGDEGTPIKIGTARNPARRLGELQTGSWQSLYLLHTIPGDRMLEATFRVSASPCSGRLASPYLLAHRATGAILFDTAR